MLLLLDNYDSFTYNLYQYLAELGAEVNVIRNDAVSVDQIMAMKLKGIVLSPGPGRPEQAGIMNKLITANSGKIPMLGVCLGHQAIGQVYGGSITYAPELMHGKTSAVEHDKSKLYANVPSPFTATRYHSLVIDPKTLSKEFTRTAWTGDVIMGIQHRALPIYGVQFHPESIMTTHGKQILKNFLETL